MTFIYELNVIEWKLSLNQPVDAAAVGIVCHAAVVAAGAEEVRRRRSATGGHCPARTPPHPSFFILHLKSKHFAIFILEDILTIQVERLRETRQEIAYKPRRGRHKSKRRLPWEHYGNLNRKVLRWNLILVPYGVEGSQTFHLQNLKLAERFEICRKQLIT